MRSTFAFASALTALLALGAPAIAQQPPDGSGPSGTSAAPAKPAETPAATSDAEAAAAAAEASWKKGRPITMQYFRPQDKRGINMFETTKDPGVEFTGFKMDFGAGFSAQLQDMSHNNSAVPNVVNGVNANQLMDIGMGFNNPTANVNLYAQLAPGIRVDPDELSVGAAP